MTPPPCVVVSPHLDDVVLSCCGRLLDGRAEVVTVCAGIPPADATLSRWDADSGATSASERARERLAEDDEAFAVLDVPTRRLDELGEHYRRAPFDVARVTERLTPLLDGAEEVWLPAGVGGHGAHVGTSQAALAAARRQGTSVVMMYVDLPYALAFGWPDDCDGLSQELRRRGHDTDRLTPVVRALTRDEQRLKQRAASCYRTQLGLLDMTPAGRFAVAAADTVELAFRVSL